MTINYIAKDDTIFETEEECLAHEEFLEHRFDGIVTLGYDYRPVNVEDVNSTYMVYLPDAKRAEEYWKMMDEHGYEVLQDNYEGYFFYNEEFECWGDLASEIENLEEKLAEKQDMLKSLDDER